MLKIMKEVIEFFRVEIAFTGFESQSQRIFGLGHGLFILEASSQLILLWAR